MRTAITLSANKVMMMKMRNIANPYDNILTINFKYL